MKIARAVTLLLLASTVASANPSGKKWFTLPVSYRIAASVDNTGGTQINGGIAYATVVGRTQAAFTNWGKTKVTTCPGATTWDVTYTGSFSSPSGAAMISSTDNFNSVGWISGSAFAWGSSTLGITFTQYFPTTGELDEADMAMNNNVSWSDLCGGAFNSFDYESVILHESGHFLGLDHSSTGAAVMFPTVSNGQCKRALQSADITDVCTVYPGSTGSQGSPCSTSTNCTSGRVCKSAAGSTSGICTSVCTSSSTCTTGYTCQAAEGGGMACLPQLGAADLCKFCSSGSDCSTGQCVTDGAGHFFCSSTCTSAAACGPGYSCISTSGGGLCAPTNPCSNQCTGTGQSVCAIGYTCVSGRCEPLGNPGDRCELSEFCKTCGICIGTNAEAYCRTCCGGTNDCNTCPNAACTTGNACVQLSNSTDKVCVPNVGAALCTACNASTPCLNGNSCVAGRCHAACNPQSPGSCTACLDQGGTSGVCACSNEVATVGQICGVQTNGGFFACQTGLYCTGAPKTCKKPCTLGNNSTCNTGEVCQTEDNKAVCVAASMGQRCAACATTTPACSSGLTCNSSRCYEPCNVNSSSTCGQAGTTDCVQLQSDGTGVCACSDQKVGVDQQCGANPIRSCQIGLKCISGYCRSECNIASPSCSIGLECRSYAGAGGLPYCQTAGGAGGGGGGTSCIANSFACTSSGSCCSGNCVSGAGTTICQPSGTGGGSGAGGSSGAGGGSTTGAGGGTSCIALGSACTSSGGCCSGTCGAGAGGAMVCLVPGGTGGSNGSGGGSSSAGGGDGTGGGGTTNPGCGCSTGFAGMAAWQLLAIAALGLRRRKHR
jgi:MYXO-CTERM domain-containing protein